MFVLVVLAVIGLGVGVVAATMQPRVYGPSWGRFSAAFSGRVHVVRSGPVASAAEDDPLRYLTTYYYANQSFNGWVAYAPLSGVIFPVDLRAVTVTEVSREGRGSRSAMRLIASGAGGYLGGHGVRNSEQVANGLRVVTIGPRCGYGECYAAKIVSNGRVEWNVLASANGPASAVESFLASFQPIG
jgi:hypothetical protein